MYLMSLPQTATDKICRFLDNESVLRMREVSKQMKENVDFSNIHTRKFFIDAFVLHVFRKEDSNANECRIFCRFVNLFVKKLWKTCFVSILKTLDIPIQLDDVYHAVDAKMEPGDMEKLLKSLKSLMQRASVRGVDVQCLYIYGNSSQYAPLCSSFIDLIPYVRPKNVFFKVTNLTNELLNCALRLADITYKMYLNFFTLATNENSILSVTRDMLNRKCNNLTLKFDDAIVSLSNGEKLLEILHRSEKKVKLIMDSNAQPMAVKIGVYKIEIWDTGRTPTDFIIEHLRYSGLA